MELPSSQSVRGDFDKARFSHASETFEFLRAGDAYSVRVQRKGKPLETLPVRYTFGLDPLQQYLVDVGHGRLQALSVAWDTRPKQQGGQRWFHLHGSERIEPGDRVHWRSGVYTWNTMCADCHSTGVTRGYEAAKDRYRTTYAEIDVACEACHGPGSRHVAWAQNQDDAGAPSSDKGWRMSLRKPEGRRWVRAEGENIATLQGAAASDPEVDTCAPCHSRRSDLGPEPTRGDTTSPSSGYHDRYRPSLLEDRLYFPDGQIREEVFEYGSFLQSKMFARGVVCSDCHEPHSLGLRAEGNALCATCHNPSRYDAASHHMHEQGSEAARCVTCHMPATTYMQVDPRRDHRLGRPAPALHEKLGSPDVCTGCHADKSPGWAPAAIERQRGSSAAAPAVGEDGLWLAQRGQRGAAAALTRIVQSPSAPAILRATALAELSDYPSPRLETLTRNATRDPHPLVRRAAAMLGASLQPERRWDLLRPLLDDPARAVRIEVATTLLDAPAGTAPADSTKLQRALSEYVASLDYNADRPEALVNLADLALRAGDAQETERLLRKALEHEPSFSAAYLNLADLYRSLGAEDRARATLQAGLERADDPAMLQHSLGLAFVRARRTEEGLALLESAHAAAPNRARFGYVYAIALFDTGKVERALDVLRRLYERRPGDAPILAALADYTRRAQHLAEAERYERELQTLTNSDGARTAP